MATSNFTAQYDEFVQTTASDSSQADNLIAGARAHFRLQRTHIQGHGPFGTVIPCSPAKSRGVQRPVPGHLKR